MKKLIYGVMTLLLLVGCAKDLNEEIISVQTESSEKINGKYVDIAEAPEILSAVKAYNRGYNYLVAGQSDAPKNRIAENLDLDLDHILKILDSNGNETFIIAIKKAFAEYEDIYLENLNIYKKDGIYQSKILKYNALDDEREFDMKNFTGDLEIFDKDRNALGIIKFEDGVNKCEKYWPTFGDWSYVIYDDGSWYAYYSGGGNVPSDGPDGFSTGGWSFTGGYGSSGGLGNNGTSPNNPSDPESVDHTPIVPNNIWPEVTSQIDMANRICSRLGLSLGVRSWMRNPTNIVTTYETYSYMQPIQQIGDMNFDVISDGIQSLSGGSSTFNPILLEDQITSTLPPCLDAILNDVKSLPNGKFGSVMRQFVGLNPVTQNYNWTLTSAYFPPSAQGLQPDAARTSGSNPAITTINDFYLQKSTDLSFARTMIHEAFHAYLSCVYRFRNFDMSYVNLINQYATQFNNNRNDIDHHIFAQNNIINHISQALMEYGALKGYTLSQQFCDDMAWAGLIGTSAFNGLPQSQQDRIRSRLEAETFNNNNNLLNLSPVGQQPCP